MGALVRLAVAIAYRPALFFSDSWQYLNLAFSRFPAGIAPSRPSGYPLLLRLLTLGGDHFSVVTTLQHVSGLVVAVLVYVLALRMDLPRWVAVAAAAVLALDSYTITLEQHVLAESFFTLALTGAIVLTIAGRRNPRALFYAGGLLAIACVLRTVGLFILPVWLIYLVWTGPIDRRLIGGVLALALPLLAYSTLHSVHTEGSFGLTQAQGWFLYGRVASIADCRGAAIPPATRPLCVADPRVRRALPPNFWIWEYNSPAQRLFGGNPDHYVGQPGGHQETARINELLNGFAVAIIRRHFLAYAELAGSDLLRFFDPAEGPMSNVDGVTITLPATPRYSQVNVSARNRYYPGYVPKVHWPAPLLLVYQRVFHAPRGVLAALTLAAILALVAPLLGRRRLVVKRRPEIFLLTGGALVMLAASAMFAAFVVRYLIPVIPLLLCGGLAATNELTLALRSIRTPRRAIRDAHPDPAGA